MKIYSDVVTQLNPSSTTIKATNARMNVFEDLHEYWALVNFDLHSVSIEAAAEIQ